jgi:uncharacterized protein (DUF952 family)
MSKIYHITSQSEWQKAKETGFYVAPSLNEEGFIHCCDENQVDFIKEKYYANSTDLVNLCIETTKLSAQFVFEWSPSLEQTFPHVYGPINVEAVERVEEV